jgi:hypothetical protein
MDTWKPMTSTVAAKWSDGSPAASVRLQFPILGTMAEINND